MPPHSPLLSGSPGFPGLAHRTVSPATPSQPSQRVFLHIGLLKTGTSFLQDVLLRNRGRLCDAGVLYPTDESDWGLQVRAARDVLAMAGPRPAAGSWADLVSQVGTFGGQTSIVSIEFLSFADDAAVRRVVTAFEHADVHVIITLRDLARVVPSAWQSTVKQGHTWPYDVYERSVMGDPKVPPVAGDLFWRHHDAERIAKRWLNVVGPSRLHLVTVPPSGALPDALWGRFANVLGLDPAAYDAHAAGDTNASLTFSETEFVRAIHLATAGRLSRLARKRWGSRYLANRLLRRASDSVTPGDMVVMRPAARRWAASRSEALINELGGLGARVYGTLDDLRVPSESPGGSLPAMEPRPAVTYPERAANLIAEILVRLAEVDPEMPDGHDDSADPRPAGSRGGDPVAGRDDDRRDTSAIRARERTDERVRSVRARPD